MRVMYQKSINFTDSKYFSSLFSRTPYTNASPRL